ncbi:MAG: hypothetical protein IGS48_24285 [Oscillatoriales cyanobacterium C42_A2020_001]|nr:hypothetical protein [Leptolyngbyaceae cyanobacterium C42_A2020_001]
MESFFSFVVSTTGVVVGIVAKSLWDRLLARQEELTRLRRNKKLEILEKQLSEFYLPLYIRLVKDNLVWMKVFEQTDNPLSSEVRKNLELKFILPNHDEIMKIIESKIHLARADQRLSEEMSKYIRHIAVYKALRESGVFDKDPIAFGEPFPKDFFNLCGSIPRRSAA